MKIPPRTKKGLNNQVLLEAAASSSYLGTASWCETAGYPGAATYFYAQSAEERDHMLKVVRYLNSMGSTAVIPAVPAPSYSHKSLEGALKASLRGEQQVTRAIHALLETAQAEKDHSTAVFLEWFVTEQVQEETKFEAVLQRFDVLGRDRLAVAEIDRELGASAPQPGE
ncbi:MAG: ferritin [Nitrosopumilus sp.]|nr:ferritin [Nitrosopumilus sp.]CAI9832723.1 putative ferritin-2 [Nitrosopumilaceae archaeon]MDA7940708.1 ferritin [Nitrosopumilus sp.]MDA7942916.1 ferritin [Nitrosopumilus sp.]MDA7944673.1 ferritin [Nitrosopumilus sp.]